RPRTRRIRAVEEGGKVSRQMQCKRCGQFGHMMKTCNETVYDSDAPPPAKEKPQKKKIKKSNRPTSIVSTQQSQTRCSTSTALLTNSPAANTRGRKRQLEIEEGASSPAAQPPEANKVKAKKVKKQLLKNLDM
ncbi:unnamed protein product, partial [Urochloa humidicola]